MPEYIAEVRKIVSDTFFLDPAAIGEDTPLEELGIDSKGRIRLLAMLEVHYKISLDLDRRDQLTDVGAVAKLVAEARRPAPGDA
ncbi:acyl carrier protein [Amycolatopsis acidicola]|uniref:acyl carrier protein n=1 Tax=Amycolatopsis acidicola TaxID=2596893 RepID=UPI001FB7A006|nr:acyl carrier protein [Amycolatopsis acidicola]